MRTTKNMDTNNAAFEWFDRELESIKSRRFHILEPVVPQDLFYQGSSGPVALKGDYATFLAKYGYARLFTDYGDAPTLSVYPLKHFRQHCCEDGRVYVGFGFRGQQSVFFDEQEILSTGSSKVYVVNKKNGREVAGGLAEWFKTAYEWSRSKYSAGKWKKVVDGPKPFSDEEMRIVEARRQFKWRHTGFADDGDATFEIENNSSRKIPYLTIGIRDKNEKILVGAVWLAVGHIEPGEKAIIKKGCYKDRIPPSELEPFEMPDPIPEKKEAYWEFGEPL